MCAKIWGHRDHQNRHVCHLESIRMVNIKHTDKGMHVCKLYLHITIKVEMLGMYVALVDRMSLYHVRFKLQLKRCLSIC